MRAQESPWVKGAGKYSRACFSGERRPQLHRWVTTLTPIASRSLRPDGMCFDRVVGCSIFSSMSMVPPRAGTYLYPPHFRTNDRIPIALPSYGGPSNRRLDRACHRSGHLLRSLAHESC